MLGTIFYPLKILCRSPLIFLQRQDMDKSMFLLLFLLKILMWSMLMIPLMLLIKFTTKLAISMTQQMVKSKLFLTSLNIII